MNLPVLRPDNLQACVECLRREDLLHSPDVADALHSSLEQALQAHVPQHHLQIQAQEARGQPVAFPNISGSGGGGVSVGEKAEHVASAGGNEAGAGRDVVLASLASVDSAVSTFAVANQYMNNVISTFNGMVADLIPALPSEIDVMAIFEIKLLRILKSNIRSVFTANMPSLAPKQLLATYVFLEKLVGLLAKFNSAGVARENGVVRGGVGSSRGGGAEESLARSSRDRQSDRSSSGKTRDSPVRTQVLQVVQDFRQEVSRQCSSCMTGFMREQLGRLFSTDDLQGVATAAAAAVASLLASGNYAGSGGSSGGASGAAVGTGGVAGSLGTIGTHDRSEQMPVIARASQWPAAVVGLLKEQLDAIPAGEVDGPRRVLWCTQLLDSLQGTHLDAHTLTHMYVHIHIHTKYPPPPLPFSIGLSLACQFLI